MDLWKLVAGLMLFILAMSLIEEAAKAFAGNRLRQFVGRSTRSPLQGLLTGTVATAILQSSSLVGLLVLAFVGAGILPLTNALLIVFGANLGTTFTGWLVTLIGFKLDLEALSFPLIATGGLLWTLGGQNKVNYLGRFVLAVGLLLMGLEFMKSAVDSVRDLDATVLGELNAWQYLAFGVLFSAIVQSSSAVMVVTLSALNLGIIDLHSAAALVIGADLGTTSTVVLGAMRGSANTKRVALGHVLFNVVTDALAFSLLVPLVRLVETIDDPLFALVAFHSTFNFIGICLCTPFVARLAKFLNRRFVDDEDRVSVYLDKSTLEVPEAGLEALHKELGNLTQRVVEQNSELFDPTGELDIAEFRRRYHRSKRLEAEILAFSLKLDVTATDGDLGARVSEFLRSARQLLLSSKLCQDNLLDLQDLATYQPPLYRALVGMASDFYELLEQYLQDGNGVLSREGLIELGTVNHRGHEHVHEMIYESIKAGDLPLGKVSTVLNVNRALHNANNAILEGMSGEAESATGLAA